jgi:hypothetical protein
MRWRQALRVLAIASTLLVSSGCEGKSRATVQGTIALDGQPIEIGAISFIPVDGQSPTTGGPISNGHYSVPNVPVGEMKVAISGSKVVGKKKLYEDQPNSPEMPITENPVPAKFSDLQNTTLRIDVHPGKNDKNWELNSK